MPMNVAYLLCSLESTAGDPATAPFLVNDEEERRSLLPLVLQAYRLADTGAITTFDDVPMAAVNEVYQQALFEPRKVYDQKTFNRHDLKSEYRFLFEFVHNVFFSYLGSNESVTLLKLKVVTAVVKQLDVNWARLLVNLFIKEAEERPARVKVKMQLRHDTKLSIILQRTLANRVWPVCTGFPEDKLVPHTSNQLIMILGILPHKINKARGAAKRLLMEMRDSKEDVEEESENEEEDEDKDDDEVEQITPPASPKQDRKGKRKMIEQPVPSLKRITRSVVVNFVEADPKPASPTQPAPPQTGSRETGDQPQVEVKPVVNRSVPSSPSTAQDQAPSSAPPGFAAQSSAAPGSSSAAPPSINSSSAVDHMLSFFKIEFLKMSRKLNLFELRDVERQKKIDEKIDKTDAILTNDLKELSKRFDNCLKELHDEVVDLTETVAQQTFKKQAPSIISDHDLVNTDHLTALELENEMYIDAKVEALQAENAKLWEFIKAHVGEVKKDEHRQFVVDKGQ